MLLAFFTARPSRFLLSVLLTLNLALPTFARLHSEIDSLKTVLSGATDTTRARTLFRLVLAYQHSEPDSAWYYNDTLLSLARTLHDNQGRGDGLLNRGRLRRDQGNYAEALQDMTTSLDIYRAIPDSVQIANALNDISIVYAMSGDDEQALSYFEETLELFRAINDTKGESHALNNIGIMHQSAGRLDVAKDYFIRSIRMKEARRDTLGIPRSYVNLAELLSELGELAEALHYYQRADSLFRNVNDQQGLSANLDAIANFYLKQDKPQLAKRYATESLDVAQAVNMLPRVQKASQTLAAVSERLNDYSAAYRYLQLYATTKDSLHSEAQSKQLEELKAQFDSEKQTNEIALLKKDQQLQQARLQREKFIKYALLGGVGLLLVLLFVFYFAYRTNRRQKKLLRAQNHEIEQQKKDLQELNRTKDRFFSIISHDIKGPLNTLKGFVFLLSQQVDAMSRQEVQEMSSRIGESLNNLHQLLENLLAWSLSQIQRQSLTFEVVSVYELTQDIFHLYEPTATEKQVRLINQANAGALVWADSQSVHTVLRNLVANSIKYSYADATVTISTQIAEGEVFIKIIDQGTGMDQETVQKLFALDKKASEAGTANETGSGFGLVLCEELVKKNQGQLRVESKVGEGSVFIVTLPLATSVTRSKVVESPSG